MADYRSFCHSCGNEVNFGGHKSDCSFLADVKQEEQRAHEVEMQMRAEYQDMSSEELVAEMQDLDNLERAYERRLMGLRHHKDLLRDHLLEDKDAATMYLDRSNKSRYY